MNLDEKKCARCAEAVKWDAKVCKHCGNEFSIEDVSAAQAEIRGKIKRRRQAAGCGCLGMFGATVLFAVILAQGDKVPAKTDAATEAEREQESLRLASMHEMGLHCTRGDGQFLPDLGKAVIERLRDPSSFQHIGTSIMPADEKGIHKVEMRYRAANGYGGLDVDTATAQLTNRNCNIEVISVGRD